MGEARRRRAEIARMIRHDRTVATPRAIREGLIHPRDLLEAGRGVIITANHLRPHADITLDPSEYHEIATMEKR